MRRFYVLFALSLISILLVHCDDSDPIEPEPGGSPSVRIISPVDSGSYILNRDITFAGVAVDGEDGYLPDSSLLWRSDMDGILGTGALFVADTLSVNVHAITLSGVDSDGRAASDEVTIEVNSAYAYDEDFETDPGWVSLSTESPPNAYWDSLGGNYRVRTFDNLEDKYWGYSPEFDPVPGNSMITIRFDMLCERSDWGTYPGIYLYGSEPTDIDNESKTFQISFVWTDKILRRIMIRDKDQNNVYTPVPQYEENIWYKFELIYDGLSEEADIAVTRLDTGTIFYMAWGQPFVLDDFSFMAMGYYNDPNYGDTWCPIRIDNIAIQSWDRDSVSCPGDKGPERN